METSLPIPMTAGVYVNLLEGIIQPDFWNSLCLAASHPSHFSHGVMAWWAHERELWPIELTNDEFRKIFFLVSDGFRYIVPFLSPSFAIFSIDSYIFP